ncbi:hypothetical protein HD554DRAFT_2119826 [Boletus coccyginus]|nr:hypothetical protein HD554DRAFT_2119826 [Boletus coccyginus]
MTISSNHALVTSGNKKITILALCGILPSYYFDNLQTRIQTRNKGVENLERTIQRLRNQLAESQDSLTKSLRAQEEILNSKIAPLEKTIQELCKELAKSQRATNEQNDSLNEIIRSLRASLHSQKANSDQKIATLNQEKDTLNETINSLRADLRTRDKSSSTLRVQLADARRKADGHTRINRAHEQKQQYESLYGQGRMRGAEVCLLKYRTRGYESQQVHRGPTFRWVLASYIRIKHSTAFRVYAPMRDTGSTGES